MRGDAQRKIWRMAIPKYYYLCSTITSLTFATGRWTLACIVLPVVKSSLASSTTTTELRNVMDMADISVQKSWKVGVKSLGEYTVLQNHVLFWVNLSNKYEILSSNKDYMIERSAVLPQK